MCVDPVSLGVAAVQWVGAQAGAVAAAVGGSGSLAAGAAGAANLALAGTAYEKGKRFVTGTGEFTKTPTPPEATPTLGTPDKATQMLNLDEIRRQRLKKAAAGMQSTIKTSPTGADLPALSQPVLAAGMNKNLLGQ